MKLFDLFEGNEQAYNWHSEPEQRSMDATRSARLDREREPEGSEAIDARLRAQNDQLAQYAQSGNFWLKQKDTQEHISDQSYTGKAAANAAAVELLKQRPELRGNLVITAYGPGEQQGVAEAPGAETLGHNQSTVSSNLNSLDLGEDSKPNNEAGKAIQSLKNLAVMKPELTMQKLIQAGKGSIVDNAIMACKQLKQQYLQSKQQGNAQFVYNLENEIDNFKRGYDSSTPDGDTMDLSDLMRGILSKVNFQQGMAEGDISQLEKDIADAPVAPIANMEGDEKIGGRYDADDFDDMVARLKKLAGAGPMQTKYDPARRVYRNVPTAQQPPQQPKK